MAPNICCYQGCYTQRYPCGSVTFFQLPTDEPRRSQWIWNSGNKQLLNLKSNQKRYLCENHFQKSDIKSHSYRKILHKNAVPVPYDNDITTTTVMEAHHIEIEFQHAEVTSNDNTYQDDKISEDNDGSEIEEDLLLSPNQSCILYSDNEEEMRVTICTEDALSTAEMNVSQTELISIPTTRCDLAAHPETISSYINCEAIISPEIDELVFNSTVLSDKDCIRSIETISTQKLEMNNDNENNCDINATTMTSKKSYDIPKESILLSVKNQQSSQSGEECLANIKQLQEEREHQSYESDKHFALSLVYYFQRLNAKKNMKAKFDILSYLMALEQDDDALLGSDKLERKANSKGC